MSTIKPKAPMLVGLDIGSSKVAMTIGVLNSEGHIDIAGVGRAPNAGVRQGVVVNIEATTDSIKKSKEEAELMSGYQIHEVWVGVSGSHIHSFESKGMIAIKNKEVTKSEIERVIDAARAVNVPNDRMVLHVLPREFRVDGQGGISDPIGMSGVRLEASVQIITGSATAIQNTIKCVEKADLKVAGLVLESLAASYAILSDDEKNLGVCLIDMGGGITNLLYYSQGSVHHASTIPVGGQHFTHDVAVGLRTPQVSADDLKKKYGCAMASMISESETIEVEGVGGRNPRTIPRKDLADVIEARAEEILSLVGNDIRMSGLLPLLGSGVVFTGGASQLEGLVEMGEFVFDVPVRRGSPNKVKGLVDAVKSSEFATAVGLVLYALEQKKDTINQKMDNQLSESIEDVAKKVKSFFEQLF